MAGRTKHGLLATAAELRSLVLDHGVLHFEKNILRQQSADPGAGEGLLPLPRLFHDPPDIVPNGRRAKHIPFVGRPHVQPDG